MNVGEGRFGLWLTPLVVAIKRKALEMGNSHLPLHRVPYQTWRSFWQAGL